MIKKSAKFEHGTLGYIGFFVSLKLDIQRCGISLPTVLFIKRPESFDAGFKRHNFLEMRKYLLTLELN